MLALCCYATIFILKSCNVMFDGGTETKFHSTVYQLYDSSYVCTVHMHGCVYLTAVVTLYFTD